ncbi:MAG: hypothetical protein J07HQW2_00770 [Haloquadratum walsbyi J07HQW2]|uniref:Uncharacterized protein n=1 Tax=Haloquadratum walsbyi J07HQW2 TaxID=1238425 RepID=U1PPU8_9EURY|nr:MAG: hypothetical protein J07HQW2_00770 [Haloquadratum walsbyi J07HQW2]
MPQQTITQTENNNIHHESFATDINTSTIIHSLSGGLGHIMVHDADVERAALSRKDTCNICDTLEVSVQKGAWRYDYE